jgi:hypothetical protein
MMKNWKTVEELGEWRRIERQWKRADEREGTE